MIDRTPTMPAPARQRPAGPDPIDVYERLRALRASIMAEAEVRRSSWSIAGTGSAGAEGWAGTANLADYLALRGHDVRRLQADLADLGLSSLGRCEAHVLPTVDAILTMLGRALDDGSGHRPTPTTTISEAAAEAEQRLQRNGTSLFGTPRIGRHPRIMVTLPPDAATDPSFVAALVSAGMDCARINCGHDTPDTWRRMAVNVRTAAATTGRSCSVLTDLSGPRLRIGPIGPGPEVVRVRPRRDARGTVVTPGLVTLDGTATRGAAAPGRSGESRIAVDPAWIEKVRPGDAIEFTDLPGRHRRLVVVSAPAPGQLLCSANAGCYLGPGVVLRHLPRDGGEPSDTSVGPIDALPADVRVAVGDELVLTRDDHTGLGAVAGSGDDRARPARVPIGVPQVIDHLLPGHRVVIDGGAITAVVDRVEADGAHLVIETAKPGGSRIRSDKGLNFPDTHLPLPSLTDEDRVALDTVIEVADAVGYSFVRCAADVDALVAELDRRGGERIAILAKIETADAVANLPEIIIAGARNHPLGVMIARGDLAAEIGYQRLADVQEEILWICEAAHVPTVWATQVLDHLVHTGVPTRAEITDAVAAQGAECVMLNKGPFLLDGVEALHDLLRRMAPRHHKKTPLLPILDLEP